MQVVPSSHAEPGLSKPILTNLGALKILTKPNKSGFRFLSFFIFKSEFLLLHVKLGKFI